MKFFFKIKTKQVFFLIVVLAGIFRFYGLNWDQSQHLHPDERFLTMVATAVKIPSSFIDYLNPQISTMSPYNNNYSFFVYGTFPLYLTKVVGVLTGNNDYGNIHFVGRILSALFDIGTVFLLFKIGQKIFNEKIGLLAAFLYSIMVLPIQLSHFFAVDTFLNFFLVLSFYLLILLFSSNSSFLLSLLLGISFGLALACKISALYFLPIIGLGYLYLLFSFKKLKYFQFFSSGIVFALFVIFTFRLAQPTAFSSGNLLSWQPNPQFVANLKELKNLSGPDSWFPPSVQWHSTKPIIFPLKNLVLWGMGLPLGIISIVSVFFFVIKKPKIYNVLIVVWILGLFTYQGLQFGKTMRYFLPIYPFLALSSACFVYQTAKKLKEKLSPKIFFIFYFLFFILTLIYPVSFMSIYFRPITRVTASGWIYENVPAGSTVTFEEWDDGLPLGLPNYPRINYTTESLFMYDFDTPEKWRKLDEKLAKADYIFLTSNRAYGSTMKLPEKYPQTTAFYRSLFNNTDNFHKIAEFTSYPCFPPFGDKHWFCFNDDGSEEAFTVYDHPKVMIFERINTD